MQNRRYTGPRWSPSEIERMPTADLSHRGIDKAWCDKYGVRQTVSEETGELDPEGSVFYPAGVGTGWKRKSLITKKDIQVIGDYKGLFGQNVVRAGRMVIVTEGEEDCLSVAQMLEQAGKDYPVVSVPNGAAGAARDLLQQLEWLKNYEIVVLCFDQDDAGVSGAQRAADALMTELEVRIMSWDAKLGKDANDLLRSGHGSVFWKSLCQSRRYHHSYSLSGSEVPFEIVKKPAPGGVSLSNFPKLNNKLQTLRKGELTTIIAPAGAGKSTLAAEIGYEILRSTEDRVAFMFLEEPTEKGIQRIVALDNNVSLARFRHDPGCIPEENVLQSYKKYIESGKSVFARLPKGALPLEELMPLLRYYYYAEGVSWVILDHISYIFSADDRDNERKLIDNVLHDLAAYVTETGVGVILVAHMKRTQQKEYQKDDAWQAVWRTLDLDAGRGSGAFEQLSHNVLTLEPELVDDPTQRRTRIFVRKNREWGYIGMADVYRMDYQTGRLVTCEPPDEEF